MARESPERTAGGTSAAREAAPRKEQREPSSPVARRERSGARDSRQKASMTGLAKCESKKIKF